MQQERRILEELIHARTRIDQITRLDEKIGLVLSSDAKRNAGKLGQASAGEILTAPDQQHPRANAKT